MKYTFDFLEIEIEDDCSRGVLYLFGRNVRKKVHIFLEPKGRIQSLFTHESARDYPNIVLKNAGSIFGSKLRLNKV